MLKKFDRDGSGMKILTMYRIFSGKEERFVFFSFWFDDWI